MFYNRSAADSGTIRQDAYQVKHMDFSKLETDQDTIASFFEEMSGGLTPISLNIPEQEGTREFAHEDREFRIRLANTEERRESANILINKMYSWRGYDNAGASGSTPNRITLIASGASGEVIGTISIGMDSPAGLFADEMYHEELEALRNQGRKVCEFNKLAIDTTIKSKRILSSLLHVAYLYPYGLFGYTDGVLEVNPRHVKFYEKMMGFTQIGPERICPRVHAPGVLLRTNFAYVNEQVEEYGGLMDKADGVKSLYPYFFTKADEAGILGRLRTMA
jgi:hypothetical protein